MKSGMAFSWEMVVHGVATHASLFTVLGTWVVIASVQDLSVVELVYLAIIIIMLPFKIGYYSTHYAKVQYTHTRHACIHLHSTYTYTYTTDGGCGHL